MGLAAAFALWGNKMDLSIWPADAENSSLDVFAKILHAADENLLHDDTDELTEHCEMLRERGWGKIDIIVDNAGFELVTVSSGTVYFDTQILTHTIHCLYTYTRILHWLTTS